MVQLVPAALLCFVVMAMHSPSTATAVAIYVNSSQQMTPDAPIQQESHHQSSIPDTEMPPPWTSHQQFETSFEQQSSPSSSGADAETMNKYLPAQANLEPLRHQNSTGRVNATTKNATSPAPFSATGNREEAGHDASESNKKIRTPQVSAVASDRRHHKHDVNRSCSGDYDDASSGGSHEDMNIDSLSKQQDKRRIPTTPEPPATLELPPAPADDNLNLKTSSSTRPRSNALSTVAVVAIFAISALIACWSVAG